MKVLVTGGAGYFGSVLSHMLLGRGHQVKVVDNLLHGNGESLLGLVANQNFSFHFGDIRSVSIRTKALADVEAVVHLAAIVGDPACSRQPDLAKQVNLDASLDLVVDSQRQGVRRFVFASTCSNYGRMADPSKHLNELSPLRPISLYAETKVAFEKHLLDMNESLQTCILRISTLYGLSPRMRFDLTVNEFTMELMTRKKLVVYGEQFWRPYVHVADACRAVCLSLEAQADKIQRQVFNVGDTEENYTKGQLLERIVSQVGHQVEIERIHKDEDPRDYRVAFEKIKDALDFSVTKRVPDGIAEIAEAIKQGVFIDVRAKHHRN